ncbi:hypothetical protein [Phyllobacterium sp. OV277]|uniref:hypothetical protein n=1 Tax=Phyllobacterium sp. OV277 TaxID=1882772 RepID=UPI0008894D0E|nr:hypothetical protein [Phyllobacterium sp. OV277]SDP63605.1 hypothetical protein SAMN05443582_10751 [Phyllobacterium sp. OV277]
MRVKAHEISSDIRDATETGLLCLQPGYSQGLRISPRWPSSHVHIDREAFNHLLAVCKELPEGVTLILTRGYEQAHSRLGLVRRVSRRMGIKLFQILYSQRRSEIAEIFGANGHDVDGTHIEVSIAVGLKRLRFLPLGVFTPETWQKAKVRRHQPDIDAVKAKLREHGFRIHRNHTESLQIHCDLIPSKTPDPDGTQPETA